MNIWMHKETGELAIARRVWLETDFPGLDQEGHAIQFASSVSSWAFQNKYGVVMILPTKIQESFEDLGEL